MKIERNILSEFLRKVSLSVNAKEGTLNFTESGLKCKLFHPSKTIYIIAEIDKKMFKDYKPIGLIGVRDMALLKRHVDTLGKIVGISTKEGFLFLSEGGKKRIIKSADETFIDEGEVKMEFTNAIKVEKSVIDNILSGCKLFKDDIVNVTFESENGKLTTTIFDDIDKVIETAQVSICEKAKSNFRKDYLSMVFGALGDGEITLFIHDETPMKITEINKEGGLSTELIIAPMIEPADDEEEENEDAE